MQRLLLIIMILLLSSGLAWLLLVWHPEDSKRGGAELQAVPKGGDFSFRSYQGVVSLKDFRGQVVLLYFGYTWCPDICPTNLALISTILDEMSEAERAKVQPIFVSVDPARDSVDRLKEYVEYFHPKLLGVTASEPVIREVAERYGAAYKLHQEEGEANYVVDHSADTYLVGTDGELINTIPHGATAEELLAAVRPLL
ncbi:MAG: SCO family protein [Candidatus Thiodiazotropha sp. 6PLUC2]